MKIILCIFLLNITAVSVFGQSVELHGILGQSVKFPAAVKKGGILMYGTLPIGNVASGSFSTPRNVNYRDRVQWDSSTGYFSLSGLKLEDSGEYKVQNTDQNINTVFQLNVHIPVSKPHLNVTHNEYRCTILCAAVRGTGVTLTLYREGEKKPYITSPVESAPHLHLPVPVDEGGIYTCEARNSVSRETSDPLTVGAHCTAVSVFGILGESVKFPAAVKKGGFLMYSGVPIGDSSLETPGNKKYKGRLQWDSSTGLFSLSGLKMEDVGEYKVQNTDQNITVFQLNVHKDNVPVLKPHVSITQNEYPCTLLCAVERGTGVTLSWYREDQKKPYVTSPVQSAPHLHLPVPVDEGGIYTCEAKNSVSRETSDPLTVGAHCTAPSSSSTGIIVAGVIAAVVVLIAVVFAFKYHRSKRELRGIRKDIQGFIARRLGNIRELRANRSKHSTKDGKTSLDLSPDAVRTLIHAVRTLIHVKKLFDDFDLHADGDAVQAVPQSDGRRLIQVKELLDTVDLHASVKDLLDNVDLQDSGKTSLDLSPDVARSLIQDNFIYHPEPTEKMTSHQEP